MSARRLVAWAFAVALALVLFPGRALAFTPPPAPEGTYVVDTAGKLSSSDKAEIDTKLIAIKQGGGPWIAVFVARSLEGESIEDVGIATARAWKIGTKADNGVLLLIAPSERKVRIEIGSRLEGDLTDLESNDIIRNKIGPRLKENDFRGGIEAGIDAIAANVMHGTVPGAPARRHARAPEDDGTSLLGLLVFGAPIAIIVLVVILNMRRARRSGGGGGGGFFWWGGGGGGFGGGGGDGGGWGGGGGGGDSGPSGGGGFSGGGSSDSY